MDSSSAAGPEAESLQERTRRLQEALGAALEVLDGSAARLSATAGGIRFSTLQKAQGGLAWELRQLRARAPDEAQLAGLDELHQKVLRLVAALTPPDRSPVAQRDGPAATGHGSIRQALIRGMIMLAPAPLHLQIEFGAGFPIADADPIELAARSHAINRAALGSLKRIQWEAPGRCLLGFADGDQRRTVEVTFDAGGKVELPVAYRQKQQGATNQQRTIRPGGARDPKSVIRQDAGRPAPPGNTRTPSDRPDPGPPARKDRQGTSQPLRQDRQHPGQAGRNRHAKPAARGAAFPANSMFADKLRAALAPSKAAAPAPARSDRQHPPLAGEEGTQAGNDVSQAAGAGRQDVSGGSQDVSEERQDANEGRQAPA